MLAGKRRVLIILSHDVRFVGFNVSYTRLTSPTPVVSSAQEEKGARSAPFWLPGLSFILIGLPVVWALQGVVFVPVISALPLPSACAN
jgi:hypothetical protein